MQDREKKAGRDVPKRSRRVGERVFERLLTLQAIIRGG